MSHHKKTTLKYEGILAVREVVITIKAYLYYDLNLLLITLEVKALKTR